MSDRSPELSAHSLSRDPHDPPALTLDDLAHLADMTARNVRAYQQRGLLPRGKRQGRRVVYGGEHVARLRLIRALQNVGLTLTAIEDLTSRGVAEDELARINAEGVPPVTRGRVPIGDTGINLLDQGAYSIQDLLEAGVLHVEGGQLVASPAALGLARGLLERGITLATICQVAVVASRAASDMADLLAQATTPRGSAPETPETNKLVARLAAILFNDHLLGDDAATPLGADPEAEVASG